MTIVNVATKDLLRIVARAGDIVGSYGHARTTPERVNAVTRAALTVEHVHQELEEFIKFIYQRASNGKLLHVLPSGQLAAKVHTPWRGTSTLTRTERDMVRKWLLLKADNRLRPPFLYSPETRRWFLDIKRYPDVDSALSWLDNHHLTPGEWIILLT
jgi:hypothetical protein